MVEDKRADEQVSRVIVEPHSSDQEGHRLSSDSSLSGGEKPFSMGVDSQEKREFFDEEPEEEIKQEGGEKDLVELLQPEQVEENINLLGTDHLQDEDDLSREGIAASMSRVGFQAHDGFIFETLTKRGGVLVAIRSEDRAADALALLHAYGGGNAAIGAWTGRV